MRKTLSSSGVSPAFLKVLRAIADAESQSGVDALDHADRSLLYYIALNEGEGGSLKITDLERGGAFGTLPTVLARVSRLVELGWVEKELNPEDARSRVVSTSSRARRFFRKVSKTVTGPVGC